MHAVISQATPTSSAATTDTEPVVVSAISSAEGTTKLAFFADRGGVASGLTPALLLLAVGTMLGYGIGFRLWSRR